MSVVILLLALAVLCWPADRAAGRLRCLVATGRPRRRLAVPRPTTFAVAIGLGVAGWLVLGIGGAVAGGLAGATAWRRWRNRVKLRRALTAIDGLAEGLRSLVAELRVGAHPAAAAESAATDAEPQAAVVLRAVAAAARLDADVDRALAAKAEAVPGSAPMLKRLAQAWTLAGRHGLPLADVLDAVRGDLDARARFARQVQARMAGPRASATILALLPAVGVALGEAMGARPLHVLAATAPGQLLLTLGAALVCAGVTWSARITNQAVLQ